MKKLIPADTVDIEGTVWETIGENIRHGAKEFSKTDIDNLKEDLDALKGDLSDLDNSLFDYNSYLADPKKTYLLKTNQLNLNEATRINVENSTIIFVSAVLETGGYDLSEFDRVMLNFKWLDENGNDVGSGGNFINAKTNILTTNRTVPNNAKTLVLSNNIKKTDASPVEFICGVSKLLVCDIANMVNIKGNYYFPSTLHGSIVVPDVKKIRDYIETSIADITNFMTPPFFYGCIGMPTLIYNDNVVIYGKNKKTSYKPTCSKDFHAFSEVVKILPLSSDDNNYYNMKLINQKGNIEKATANIPVRVSDKTLPTGNVNVMIIGDSRTRHGYTSKRLLDLFGHDGDNQSLTLIGTCQPDKNTNAYSINNWHEGRSSWDSNHYMNNQNYYQATNSFYNPSSKTFDYAYYVSQYATNRGSEYPTSGHTYVLIHLGTNDFYHRENFETEEKAIEQFLVNIQAMIDSIHNYDSNIIIGIVPPVNIYCGNEKLAEYTKSTIDTFSNKENQNVYIVPAFASLDLKHGFENTEALVVNEHIPNVKECRSDSTHENEGGYYCTGDVYYYFIKWCESNTN